MKKKQIGTILLIVMTVGLIGAIIYFNALLNDKGPGAVTQIKKTKASAITYHKFLALNTSPPASDSSSSGNNQSDASQSSFLSSQANSSPTSSSSLPLVITPTVLTPFRPVTPQASSVSGANGNSSVDTTVILPSPTGSGSTLPAVSPTLIAYRPVTPTLIPIADTGGETVSESSSSVSTSKSSSSKSVVPTKVIPTPVGADKKLPETGWVQVSMIFFIVAATTIFISFLF